MNFFDTATTQSAIDRLIQQACESDSEILPIEQSNQQDIEDIPTQPDDDQGEQVGHVLHSSVTQNLIAYNLLVLLQNLQAVQRKRDSVCTTHIKTN